MAYPKLPRWYNAEGEDLGKYRLGLMDNEIVSYSIYNNIHHHLYSNYNYSSDDFNFKEDTLTAPLASISGIEVFEDMNNLSSIEGQYGVYEPEQYGDVPTESTFKPFKARGQDTDVRLASRPDQGNRAGILIEDTPEPSQSPYNSFDAIRFNYYIVLPKFSNKVGDKMTLLTSISVSKPSKSYMFDWAYEKEHKSYFNYLESSPSVNMEGSVFKDLHANVVNIAGKGESYVFSRPVEWVMVDPTEVINAPTFKGVNGDQDLALYRAMLNIPLYSSPKYLIGGWADPALYVDNISVFAGVGTGNAHQSNVKDLVLQNRTQRQYPRFNMDTLAGYATRPNALGLYSVGASTSGSVTGKPSLLLNLAMSTVSKDLGRDNSVSEYGTMADYNAMWQFTDYTDYSSTNPDTNRMFIHGGYTHPWDTDRNKSVKYESITTELNALRVLEGLIKSEVVPTLSASLLTVAQMSASYTTKASIKDKIQRYGFDSGYTGTRDNPIYNKDTTLFSKGADDSFVNSVLPYLPEVDTGKTVTYLRQMTPLLFLNLMGKEKIWNPILADMWDTELLSQMWIGSGFDVEFKGDSVPGVSVGREPTSNLTNPSNTYPSVNLTGHATKKEDGTRVDTFTMNSYNEESLTMPYPNNLTSSYPTVTVSLTRRGTDEPIRTYSVRQPTPFTDESLEPLRELRDSYYTKSLAKSTADKFPVWQGALVNAGDTAQWEPTEKFVVHNAPGVTGTMLEYFRYLYVVTRSPAGNHTVVIPNPFLDAGSTMTMDRDFYALNLADGSPYNPVVYKWSGYFEKFRIYQSYTVTGGGSANLATGSISSNPYSNRTIIEIGFMENTAWEVATSTVANKPVFQYGSRTSNK